MASGDSNKVFKWEWPANRDITNRLLASVQRIEKQKEGFFGVNKSPSIATNLPAAMVLTGKILDGNTAYAGNTFTLVLPKVELGSVVANDTIAIGLVGTEICVCLEKVPEANAKIKQEDWLKNWNCRK